MVITRLITSVYLLTLVIMRSSSLSLEKALEDIDVNKTMTPEEMLEFIELTDSLMDMVSKVETLEELDEMVEKEMHKPPRMKQEMEEEQKDVEHPVEPIGDYDYDSYGNPIIKEEEYVEKKMENLMEEIIAKEEKDLEKFMEEIMAKEEIEMEQELLSSDFPMKDDMKKTVKEDMKKTDDLLQLHLHKKIEYPELQEVENLLEPLEDYDYQDDKEPLVSLSDERKMEDLLDEEIQKVFQEKVREEREVKDSQRGPEPSYSQQKMSKLQYSAPVKSSSDWGISIAGLLLLTATSVFLCCIGYYKRAAIRRWAIKIRNGHSRRQID